MRGGTPAELVDSLVRMAGDSLTPDTTSIPKNATKERFVKQKVDLDHVVNFSSKDSIVMYGKSRATIYGAGQITYGDINLTADQITMDMDSSIVHAIGTPDSVGELQGKPVFKDNSGEYESRIMNYNFKTQKGFITDIITDIHQFLPLMRLQSLVDFVQHKIDKRTGLSSMGAGRNGIVVSLLVGIYHILYGQMLKQRMQSS